MNDLNQDIQIAFQATQLILVFVIVLFALRYPQIQHEIQKDIPSGPKAQIRLRKKLQQSLLEKCVPLLLINGFLVYLFSPLFVRVILESDFELWNFDFARTSFVFIALLIFLFFGWSIWLTYQLFRRMKETPLAKMKLENKPNQKLEKQ